MSTPLVPQLMCPQNGAGLVNGRLPMVVRKTAFEAGGTPSIATNMTAATNVEDTYGGGFPTWTSSAYLSTGNGTQAQMATATVNGASNAVNWYGISYSAIATLRCSGTATLQFGAMSTWAQPPNLPGDAVVRVVVIYRGRTIATLSAMDSQTKWAGGTPLVSYASVNLYSAITLILGANWTMSQLQTLLNEGSATNANFKVQIHAITDEDGYATALYAGPVKLAVQYFTVNPDSQGSYQFQASTDSTFATTNWDSTRLYGADDYAVVPPFLIPGGSTVYWRVRVWENTNTTASAWSSAGGPGPGGTTRLAQTVAITTLSDAGARLLTEENAHVVWLYELRFRRWMDSAVWTRRIASSPTSQYVYQATFARSTEPTANFWISGVEEDGTPIIYTEKFSVADVDATASSFYWDETNSLVYVRTSTGCSPAALKSMGMPLMLTFPIASEDWRGTGPGDVYTAEGRVKGGPSITEEIQDLGGGGVFSVPSGSLSVDNGDGLFNTLLSVEDRAYGWVAANCRISISLVGVTQAGKVRYADRVPIFDGIFTWDKGQLHRRATVNLWLASRSFVAQRYKLAHTRFNAKKSKTIQQDDIGQPIPEAVGAGHEQRKLRVVETWGALRPAKRNGTVTAIYANGVSVLPGVTTWSWNAARNLVVFVTQAAFDLPGGKSADWTWSGSGETFEGGNPNKAPSLARFFLSKAGVPTADIVKATFDALEVTGPGSTPDAGMVIEQEMFIGDALQQCMASGAFHVVPRADGKFVAVSDSPTGWSANSFILGDADLLGDPVVTLDTSHLAETARFTFVQYSKKTGQAKNYSVASDTSGPTYGADGEKVVDTIHMSQAGAMQTATVLQFERPYRRIALSAPLLGWCGILGSAVVLSVSDTLDPAGALAWQIWQVRKRTVKPDQGVELEARYIETLPATGRAL